MHDHQSLPRTDEVEQGALLGRRQLPVAIRAGHHDGIEVAQSLRLEARIHWAAARAVHEREVGAQFRLPQAILPSPAVDAGHGRRDRIVLELAGAAQYQDVLDRRRTRAGLQVQEVVRDRLARGRALAGQFHHGRAGPRPLEDRGRRRFLRSCSRGGGRQDGQQQRGERGDEPHGACGAVRAGAVHAGLRMAGTRATLAHVRLDEVPSFPIPPDRHCRLVSRSFLCPNLPGQAGPILPSDQCTQLRVNQ
jgi:hypothetical protein